MRRRRAHRPRQYDEVILKHLSTYGALTIRQVAHICEMTRTTAYYVCRKLRDEGRIQWHLLDPDLGNASQVVMQRATASAEWTEYHLQLADAPIHYAAQGWGWRIERPYPMIFRDDISIPVVPAKPTDDALGDDAIARLRELVAREVIYVDPDGARGKIVWRRAKEELGVSVHRPPSFRAREHYQHPRGKTAV